MLETERGRFIMADAWTLYRDAVEMLEQGRLRNAAEKAWGATNRATVALILERTGREPRSSGITHRTIRGMRDESPALRDLATRYSQRMQDLHGTCFYDGICEPEEPIVRDIHETADYIRDAETLAVRRQA